MDLANNRAFIALELADSSLFSFMKRARQKKQSGSRTTKKTRKQAVTALQSLEMMLDEEDDSAEGNTSNDYELCLRAMFDVAKGMQHLHNMGIMHRDLTPENILVCEPRGGAKYPSFKIADLGLSQVRCVFFSPSY